MATVDTVRPTTQRTTQQQTPAANNKVDRFLAQAMKFKGQMYLWGGGHGGTFSKPGRVDCSGLVTQAAKMMGINGLGGTAKDLQKQGKPVSMNNLKPGDLVFKGKPAHHVGIYMGNGQVLHAPQTGKPVQMTSAKGFDNAVRPNAFGGETATQDPQTNASIPGDQSNLDGGNNSATAKLPSAQIPPGGPIPAYSERFGSQSYVKNGGDDNLVNMARNAVAKAPELANTEFGKAAAAGKLSKENIKELQTFLESKGFGVGNTGVDGKYGPKTHQGLANFLEGKTPDKVPATSTDPANPASVSQPNANPTTAEEEEAAKKQQTGPIQGEGLTKDGLTIPNGGTGTATTFWNGHHAYKGEYDMGNRQNGGLGAWGDKNLPTDYFCALPVGLKGGGKDWHNQKILVTNPETGKQVVVRVQDKGPHPRTGAAIDLSPVAMEALGKSFNSRVGGITFEFAPANAPVGPVN